MDELQARTEALKLAQEWVLAFDGPHDDVIPLADLYLEYMTNKQFKVNQAAVMEFLR